MVDATQTARILIDGLEDIHPTTARRISTARALAGTCRGFGGLTWDATALQLDAYAARHQRAARGADVPTSFCSGMAAPGATTCAVCDGRGNDPHEPGLACAVCHGATVPRATRATPATPAIRLGVPISAR